MLILLFVSVLSLLLMWMYIRSTALPPVEKLAYVLFAGIVTKLSSTIIGINLNMVVIPNGLIPFLNITVSGFLVMVVIALLVSILRSTSWKWRNKLCFFLLFVTGLYGLDLMHEVTGNLRVIRWNWRMSVSRYLLLIGLTYCFTIPFRVLLDKVKVRT